MRFTFLTSCDKDAGDEMLEWCNAQFGLWGARWSLYRASHKSYAFSFDDEKDYAWFVLRWS